MDTSTLPLLALAGLGALHGINPGMGWLFAVSLGLQRQERRAVWAALGPLAMGHALAVGLALAVLMAAGAALPRWALQPLVAASLVATGGYRLFRHRHPRYGGMQVSPRQLTAWSFLMATGHGAGLMVLPLVAGGLAGGPAGSHAHQGPVLAGFASAPDPGGIVAALVHTGAYVLVTGLIAMIVYDKLGLRLLRRAWINVDMIWSIALVITGAMILIT